ncbi:MAG: hypothetical protein ACI9G1_002722 [Pirellulaceae bacterium]|jgi:uncharacterized protein (DUF1697 family)
MGNGDLRFIALLRGINVGGKNLILKEELQHFFEDLGFKNVRTYIQSGNILFRSNKKSSADLTKAIEKGLSARFSYDGRAAILSYDQYKSAVHSAPDGWGNNDQRKHNALFTLGNITPKEVSAELPAPKKHMETVTVGQNVVFWSVSKENLTKTTFMKLPMMPLYQKVTVRNHNTVFKLLGLFDEI